MIRIKNTAEDYSKSLLHRTAPKFELEPTLGGQRIRLRSFLDITEEHYARVKPMIDVWVAGGMVEVINLSDIAAPTSIVFTPPVIDKEIEKAFDTSAKQILEQAISIGPVDVVEVPEVVPPPFTAPSPFSEPTEPFVPTAPVVDEKPDNSKKHPGKKKLF